jgi:hypothetical protein
VTQTAPRCPLHVNRTMVLVEEVRGRIVSWGRRNLTPRLLAQKFRCPVERCTRVEVIENDEKNRG